MWRFLLVLLLLPGTPAAADMRAPSCEVLVALTYNVRFDAVQAAFRKRFSEMTVAELNQVLDVIGACIDTAAAAPADIPGLPPLERKTVQINLLSLLAEDIRVYRTRQRERESIRGAGR